MQADQAKTPSKEENKVKRVVRAFKQWKSSEEMASKDLSLFCNEVIFLDESDNYEKNNSDPSIEETFYHVNQLISEIQALKAPSDLTSMLNVLYKLEEYHKQSYFLIHETIDICSRTNDSLTSELKEKESPRALLQGHLLVKGKKGWKKRTVQLTRANLLVIKHETNEVMHNIHLVICSVRPASEEKKSFCFSVFNPSVIITFQAVDKNEMDAWIATIQSHILGCLEDNESPSSPKKRRSGTTVTEEPEPTVESTNKPSRNSWSAVTTKAHKRSSAPTMQQDLPVKLGLPLVGGKDVSSRNVELALSPRTDVQSPARRENSEYLALEELYAINPANRACADCLTESPMWVSINFGGLLCINCSGIHRGLGAHVSKVRSLTLDTIEPHVKKLVEFIGNSFLNSVLEANLPGDFNKSLNAKDNASREQFIKNKYVNRLYCKKHKGDSRMDPSLIEAIKMDNIAGAVALVLNGASVRASDGPRSALHFAILRGATVLITMLLLNGADPNAPDSRDFTPLHYAARAGNADCVKLLLKYGADVNKVDYSGHKPIDIVLESNTEIRQMLSAAVSQSSPRVKSN